MVRHRNGAEDAGALPPDRLEGEHEFHVYVLDVLGGAENEVYVGESWHTPEFRRQQHLDGPRKGRVFRSRGKSVGALRPDLLPPLERLRSRRAARAAEAYVAALLRDNGFHVNGGH